MTSKLEQLTSDLDRALEQLIATYPAQDDGRAALTKLHNALRTQIAPRVDSGTGQIEIIEIDRLLRNWYSRYEGMSTSPPAFASPNPAEEVRSTMNRLEAEHAVLTAFAELSTALDDAYVQSREG